MISRDVVRLAVLYDAAPPPVGRSRPPVMLDLQVEKALACPTEHVGFYLVDSVRSRSDP